MEGGKRVITVVCTGNVCRSPMGERLLAHALAAVNDLADIRVLSAGTAAFPGDNASRNSQVALRKVGLDLSDHRSRPLTNQLLEISDLVLTMTSGHRDVIELQSPELNVPVYRFREWMDVGSKEIPDPFGGPLDIYLETRDSLVEAIPSIVKFIKENLS